MTTKHCVCEEEDNKSAGGAVFLGLILLPVILVALVSSVVGFIAAKSGAERGLVRLVLFPANFAFSNFIGGMVFFFSDAAFTFLSAAFGKKGDAEWFYPRMGDYLDLTLFNVWGRVVSWFYDWGTTAADFTINIPVWHIVVFQVALWLIVGNAIANFWTTCIMKAADRE